MSSSSQTHFFYDGHASFADPDIWSPNGEVNTTKFLEASEHLVTLFDKLPAVFGMVKSDMAGNITKIRNRQTAKPAESGTLESLVTAERAEKKKEATEGLLWLLRGLEFNAKALRQTLNDRSVELASAFTNSYGETLKKHHNFVVKGLFSTAVKAAPYRQNFWKELGATEEDFATEAEHTPKTIESADADTKAKYETTFPGKANIWLSGLEKVVAHLQDVYTANKNFGM